MIENITTVDRTLFREIIKPMYKGKMNKLMIAFFVLLAIGIVLLIIRLVAGLEFLGLVLLCAFVVYKYFNSLIKKQEDAMIKGIEEQYGTDRYDVRYQVYDGVIYNQSSPYHRAYAICDIEKALDTPNYIVAMLPDQVLLAMDKRTFTKGSSEDLAALFHESSIPFI